MFDAISKTDWPAARYAGLSGRFCHSGGSIRQLELWFSPGFLAWLLALAAIFAVTGSSLLAQSQPDVQLYFFTNPGCPPCSQVAPTIESLKREGYPVTTVVLNENPGWGERFQVQRVPTVIMVANQRIVGRHEGVIGGTTLREWFSVMGAEPTKTARPTRSASETIGEAGTPKIPTMHRGTPTPNSGAENKALTATVRLKVADQQGASYATGTVIHCYQGEWLVMTCGHAFREVGYRGRITAEYNFAGTEVRSAAAELIAYDAGPRDIALVAMRTGEQIEPIKIASLQLPPQLNESVFSLGCDQGADPTIRHTQIKNQSLYDGAAKWVIHGRPAIGRSGGGLFNQQGDLIGVCNAAMVDEDEGVYTSLETVHWQIAQANLSHLFAPAAMLAAGPTPSAPTPSVSPRPTGGDAERFAGTLDPNAMTALQPNRGNSPAGNFDQPVPFEARQGAAPQRLVSLNQSDPRSRTSSSPFEEQEVIIIVRSKTDSRVGQSITISDPSPQLLDYLEEIKHQKPEPRELEMARWRQLDDR